MSGEPWEQFRFEFDADGTFWQRGTEGWSEPICPPCGEPIRWVLDMFSFGTMRDGGYVLLHARCAWTPGAFDAQRDLAASFGDRQGDNT